MKGAWYCHTYLLTSSLPVVSQLRTKRWQAKNIINVIFCFIAAERAQRASSSYTGALGLTYSVTCVWLMTVQPLFQNAK